MEKFMLFAFFKNLVMAAMLPMFATAKDGGGADDEEAEDRGDAVLDEDDDDDKTGDEEEDEPADKKKDGDETEDDTEDENKGSKTVPHARFNEVNQQKNFYKENYERLLAEAGQKKDKDEPEDKGPPEFDFDAAEEGYLKAVAEGDIKAAKAIRAEIRAADRAIVEHETTERLRGGLEETGNRITEEQKVSAFVKQAESDFPFLKKTSKDFDGALVNEILEDYRDRLKAGIPAGTAIEKSFKLVMKANGHNPDEPVGSKGGLAEQTREKKQQDSRRKNADASNRQPPKTGGGKSGLGNKDTDEVDVANLSDEEYEALPESTKKKLRGD